MRAEELVKRYAMQTHPENGCFVERHYPAAEPGRPASGSIYYFVGPAERTKFHRVDCDEYWCYIAGTPLEVWQFAKDGSLSVTRLGVEPDCDPLLYIEKGVVFAARHGQQVEEGTFLSCITVPRFSPAGFTLLEKEEMLDRYPAAKAFFR